MTFLGYEFNNGYPWLLFALILFYAGSTIKDVPYSAWGAELSTQYNERTLIMSWREGFSVAGSLIGALTPAIIVFFGYTKPTDAVYFLSIYIVIVSPIFIINNLWSVPEYPVKETRKEKLPILEGLQYVWDNEPYRKLVIIFLFSTIGAAMTNTLSFLRQTHPFGRGPIRVLSGPYFIFKLLRSRYGSPCLGKLENIEQPWSQSAGMRSGRVLFRSSLLWINLTLTCSRSGIYLPFCLPTLTKPH